MPYPLLTPSDVAALCQVSPKTVMRAIQSGRLPAARLGKRGAFRIAAEDVEAWVAASRLATPSQSRGREVVRGRLSLSDGMGPR
jgi:excisionase family DNA binding protein